MTYEEFEKRYQYDPQDDFLARGGFGAVYKAYDTVRKRHVAIKESDVNPTHKFSLLREVELSREIEPHENIVWYENPYRFTLGRKMTDYAVMPYFKHGNLNTVLTKERLDDSDCRAIAEGILKGIAHLHRQGFIHRDLKASNILMEQRNGQWIPKIADFGLSKLAGTDEGISNSAVGLSVAYAAPEQLRSETLLPNVDLWAVGVAFYKIVTGTLPFDAPSGLSAEYYTAEVAAKIRVGLPPEKAERLPQPYRTIIERCLVVDNRLRAANADELLTILQAAPLPNSEQTTILGPDALSRLSGPESSSQPSRPSAGSGASGSASARLTERPSGPSREQTGGPWAATDDAEVSEVKTARFPIQWIALAGGGVLLVGALWFFLGRSPSKSSVSATAADTTAIHRQARQAIGGESKDFTLYTALMDSLIRRTPDAGRAGSYQTEAVQTLLTNATVLFDLDDQQQGCQLVDNILRLAPNQADALTLKNRRCVR